jgi:large conductance mechanosensitive channel
MSAPRIRLGIFGEFREFIARGNVIDLAVGVIVGAAFNDIVKSLVDNVVMPPIGLMLSGIDFTHLQWVLRPDDPLTKANELVAIQYGLFINTLIKFVIVAWVVFLLVKGVNAIRRKDAETPNKTPPAPAPQEALLIEIRDILKAQGDAPPQQL